MGARTVQDSAGIMGGKYLTDGQQHQQADDVPHVKRIRMVTPTTFNSMQSNIANLPIGAANIFPANHELVGNFLTFEVLTGKCIAYYS